MRHPKVFANNVPPQEGKSNFEAKREKDIRKHAPNPPPRKTMRKLT